MSGVLCLGVHVDQVLIAPLAEIGRAISGTLVRARARGQVGSVDAVSSCAPPAWSAV